MPESPPSALRRPALRTAFLVLLLLLLSSCASLVAKALNASSSALSCAKLSPPAPPRQATTPVSDTLPPQSTPASPLLSTTTVGTPPQTNNSTLFIGAPAQNGSARYYFSETQHVYVGWNRQDDAGCVVASAFESGETYGKPDDVRVTLCSGAVQRPPQTRRKLVSCVAPLYGSTNMEILTEWCRFHELLGIDHFDIYSANTPMPKLDGVTSYSWHTAAWQFVHKRTHERGQLWAMHDCLYRARERGDERALFTDLDEWISNTTSVLGEARRAADAGYDAIMVSQAAGSGWEDPRNCTPTLSEWLKSQHSYKPSHGGGQKYLVNVQRVGRLNIHEPTGASKVLKSTEHSMFLMHDRCLRIYGGKYTHLDPPTHLH